jgi:exosortase
MANKNIVKAVILAGNRDFGLCLVGTHLPAVLWPVAGKPVIERLLISLADQGIKQATICSTGDGSLPAESIQADSRLKVKFLDDPLPVGAAGCIRGAAGGEGDETDALLVVFSATILCPPKIGALVAAHQDGKSDLTVIFNPGADRQIAGEAADIFVCSPGILEYIPKDGYFDIKEGLIPQMVLAGRTVHTVTLPKPVGNFRDRQSYLNAIANYLENGPGADTGLNLCKRADSQTAWMADNVSIHPSVRICGPVAIMDGAQISKDVVIVGPAIIERGVTIGQGSVVVNSALWDEATIGPNCQIQRCLIDYHAVVPANTIVEEESILFKAPGILQRASKAFMAVKNRTNKLRITSRPQLAGINAKLPAWVDGHKAKLIPGLAMGVVLVALLWSYWRGVVELWQMWQRSDEYSSGLLVPFLAVYVLWSRHNNLAQCQMRPCLWGIFAFIGAEAMRLFGLAFAFGSAENLAIALTIAAIVLLLFGWRLFRKVSTILLFLCLMLPWPTRIQAAIALPLQEWATSSAVFCLETMGYSVMQEGNVIHIGSASVAVAEACNGLRMVTAFFVISGLVVLLVKRAWWEKLIVFASSLPVALLCNTTRLAITALAFTVVSGEYWEKVFHDFGGYAMMPLALAAVVAELWILAKLTTPPTEKETIVITRQTQ